MKSLRLQTTNFALISSSATLQTPKLADLIDYFTGTGIGGSGANLWDNGSTGNYWSDYKGADVNHNGIGDTPYKIDSGNIDNYPLVASTGMTSSLPANKQTQPFPTLLVATIIGLSAALASAALIISYKKKKTNIKR